MDQLRFGQLLSKIIPLSDHDVEEILHEQHATNKKFGDIALSLGLAKPEHIWAAWLRQLEDRTDRVDLDAIGIDVQALNCLPADQARMLQALPLRSLSGELLVALAHIPSESLVHQLEQATQKRVKIVLAQEDRLRRAIDRYYAVKKSA
ncbi:MAG: hypothetical protein QM770_17305 [Tepidisphaeraceae bacterium]